MANWLRKKLLPTKEEQREAWKKKELKRQQTFAHLYERGQYQLASAKRKELLAKQQAEIVKRTSMGQPKAQAWDPAKGVMDALDPPRRKKRRG